MRICVVGAGAIGGVIAARLATAWTAGTRTCPCSRAARRWPPSGSAGCGCPPPTGRSRPAVAASDDAAELGPQDFVVVAVKAQSMAGVAASVGGLLGPETAVLSTLNGVPWWFLDGFGGPAAGHHLDSVDPGGKIAAVLPASRVIGGTVHLSAASPAPGEVSWRAGNGLIIGELDGSSSPRLGALAAVLRAGGLRRDGVRADPR